MDTAILDIAVLTALGFLSIFVGYYAVNISPSKP